MSIVVLVPVVWIILSAFQSGNALGNLSLSHLTLNNFQRLFSETNYGTWFVNTLEIAVVSTCCSVILIMLTSWVMSRFQFKGRKTGLLTVMILSMFPTFLSMTAIYTLFLALGLVGKPISMVIVYSIGAIPYNTWLVKGYLDGLPIAVDEAAYIDGCNKNSDIWKNCIAYVKTYHHILCGITIHDAVDGLYFAQHSFIWK